MDLKELSRVDWKCLIDILSHVCEIRVNKKFKKVVTTPPPPPIVSVRSVGFGQYNRVGLQVLLIMPTNTNNPFLIQSNSDPFLFSTSFVFLFYFSTLYNEEVWTFRSISMKTEMKNNPIGVPSLHWTTNCCAATFWWERGAGIRWIRVFGGKCGRRREELNALLKRSPERLMSIMGESRSFDESFRIIDQFDLNGGVDFDEIKFIMLKLANILLPCD